MLPALMADDSCGFLKVSASGVMQVLSDFQLFCIYFKISGSGERLDISKLGHYRLLINH